MPKTNIENLALALNKSKLRTKIFLAIALVAFYYCLQIIWFLYSDKYLNILVKHESGWHGYLPLHMRLDRMEVEDIVDLKKFVGEGILKDSPYPERWFDYEHYSYLFKMQSRSASRIYNEALIELALSKDPSYLRYLRFSSSTVVSTLDEKTQKQLLETLLLPEMMPNEKHGALLIGALYGDLFSSGKSKVELNLKLSLYYLLRGYATIGKNRSREADMIAEAFLKIGKHSDAATWNYMATWKNSAITNTISKEDETLAMRKKFRVSSELMASEELENSYKNKDGKFNADIAITIWKVLQKEWPEYTTLH